MNNPELLLGALVVLASKQAMGEISPQMALEAALKLALGEVSLPSEAAPAEAPVGKEASKGFGPNLTYRARREYVDKPESDRLGRIVEEPRLVKEPNRQTPRNPAFFRRDGRPNLGSGKLRSGYGTPGESADNSDSLRHIREESTGVEHQETRPEPKPEKKGFNTDQATVTSTVSRNASNPHPDVRVPPRRDPNVAGGGRYDIYTRPNSRLGRNSVDEAGVEVHYTPRDSRGRVRTTDREHEAHNQAFFDPPSQDYIDKLPKPSPTTGTPSTRRRSGEGVSPTASNEGYTGRRVRAETAENKALSSLNETSGGSLVAPASMLGHPIPKCSLVKKSKLFTLRKGFGPNLTHRAKRGYVDKVRTDGYRALARSAGADEGLVANRFLPEGLTPGDSQSRQIRPRRLGSFPGSPRLADSRVRADRGLYNLNQSANNSDALRHIREDSTGHQETRPETHEE